MSGIFPEGISEISNMEVFTEQAWQAFSGIPFAENPYHRSNETPSFIESWTAANGRRVCRLHYCGEGGRETFSCEFVSVPKGKTYNFTGATYDDSSANLPRRDNIYLVSITDYAYRPVSYTDPITQEIIHAELIAATTWRPDRWGVRERKVSLVTFTVVDSTPEESAKSMQLGFKRYTVLERSLFIGATPSRAKKGTRQRLLAEAERTIRYRGTVLRYVNIRITQKISGETVFTGETTGGLLLPELTDSGDLALKEINGAGVYDQVTEYPRILCKAKLIVV